MVFQVYMELWLDRIVPIGRLPYLLSRSAAEGIQCEPSKGW